MTKEQVLALLRRECRRAGSQAAWAEANGMTAAYVSDVINGRREPAEKMLDALGLEVVKIYRRKRDA